MRFEVKINLFVDREANFLEVDDAESLRVIRDLIKDALYDIDDIEILECEVEHG